jgi:hypothetical protein
MSRVSFKEFSAGLPVTQQNPVKPIADLKPQGNLIGNVLKDIPSDIVDTFKGVADAGMKGSKKFAEAFTTPGLTIPQRFAGAVAAPFSAVVNAGGEAIKGGAKLFTTQEFESSLAAAVGEAGSAIMDTETAKGLVRMYDSLPEDQKYMLSNVIAPMANVLTAGTGGAVTKPVVNALKTGVKDAFKATAGTVSEVVKRTPQEAAEAVVRSANPTPNPILDTISGAATQVKDFAKRTIGTAQDTAETSRRLAEMPEQKASLVRKGADERIVNVIEKATPEEVKVYRELVDQAKKKEIDPTPNTPQPKVIAGRELLKPVDFIINERKSVGAKLGEYRKNLSTAKDVDTNPAFRNFHDYLKNNFGVKFDKEGKIQANTGTLAASDIPQVQKLYDQLRSDTKNSQVELDQWLQRTYKDYDLVQAREKTFSEEVPRIADYARSQIRELMPEDYNALATQYATLSRPLQDFVKLVGYKGDMDKLTAKELKTAEVALRVLGNAADRPQSVIDGILETATNAGYQSNIDLNRLIYITDQLEDLYDITPTRGFSGSATRGINQSDAAGVIGDAATMNLGGLFNRAMNSRATQKEIQASFEEYLKFLDEGGNIPGETSFKKGEILETKEKTEANSNIIVKVPERDSSLTGKGAEIQEASIAKYEADPQAMVDEYLKENGKVINTDEARKLFADVGYNGANSAAVHEASSAVSKSAWREALAKNPGDKAIILAGGSGTGKTSVAKNALGKTFEESSAVLDGNLSSMGSALKRIKEAKEAGKDVKLTYVYREPEDAWVNGVIQRMLNNESEKGRVVPLSTFLENHKGSHETIKALLDNKDISELLLLDNSFGKNAQQFMDVDKFNNLSYDIDTLRSSLLAVTKQLYEQGKITEIQYKSLIK